MGYKAEDEALRIKLEAKNHLENFAYSIKNSLSNITSTSSIIDDATKKNIENEVEKTLSWMDHNSSNAEKEDYEMKQKELEAVWKPVAEILQKQQQQNGNTDYQSYQPQSQYQDMDVDNSEPKIEEID